MVMVSIIIPCKDGLAYTKQCIESIYRNTSFIRTPFEIIVISNGSTDDTNDYLRGQEKEGKLKALFYSEAMSFSRANNAAALMAKGEYLCLLNNDTITTPSWLERLLRCIRSDSMIAAVGPYANYSAGYQVSPVPCNYKAPADLDKFAQNYSQEEKYVNFLVFFCTLITRSAWENLKGLDEDFKMNYEDNLFCWQAIQKGYKLKICGTAYIHHFVGKTQGYNDNPQKAVEYRKLLAQSQKLFLHKIGEYKEISLCMIISDKEMPETLRRLLDSVGQYVDEICVVFNYQRFRSHSRLKKLLAVTESYGCDVDYQYHKWTNFSNMRNQSLEMATGDFILWLDCDDELKQGLALREKILQNPDADGFRFKLISHTELKTQEMIFHTNLFRNDKRYCFRGRVHEDVALSMKEAGAKVVTTEIVVEHTGYLDYKIWKEKNLRNYKLLLEDLKDNPHSLVYYHLVNCLLIMGGEENILKAIQLIDECLEKHKLEGKDPLLQKLWTLRGIACMDAKQTLAAKQSLHKAWDEWRNIEAGVNLAEVYIREDNLDKALEILEEIYKLKEFPVTNIPMDVIQSECLMLEKMGDCYLKKWGKEKKPEHLKRAEQHYREHLTVRPKLTIVDRLCKILRDTGRFQEAATITHGAVNMWPGYFVGWSNLASYELQGKKYHTARVFLQECLRLKPDWQEAKYNLEMLYKAKLIK